MFLKQYFHLLDRHINAWNTNQVLLFLIFIKNEWPLNLKPLASLVITQVCTHFTTSRKTLLYLQKAVETCCVPRDGISGFVWFAMLTVSVKSNRFSCHKKQLDNTYWHDEQESLHFIKLPLYRALKTVFTSFRKVFSVEEIKTVTVWGFSDFFWFWFIFFKDCFSV